MSRLQVVYYYCLLISWYQYVIAMAMAGGGFWALGSQLLGQREAQFVTLSVHSLTVFLAGTS